MTEPAVTLRDLLDAQIVALDRHLTAEIAALRRETTQAGKSARRASETATHEAEERLKAHNGLIDQMREQATLFASRESLDDYKTTGDRRFGKVERFQAMMVGALFLLSFLGISNLVRLFYV